MRTENKISYPTSEQEFNKLVDRTKPIIYINN